MLSDIRLTIWSIRFQLSLVVQPSRQLRLIVLGLPVISLRPRQQQTFSLFRRPNSRLPQCVRRRQFTQREILVVISDQTAVELYAVVFISHVDRLRARQCRQYRCLIPRLPVWRHLWYRLYVRLRPAVFFVVVVLASFDVVDDRIWKAAVDISDT